MCKKQEVNCAMTAEETYPGVLMTQEHGQLLESLLPDFPLKLQQAAISVRQKKQWDQKLQ